MNRRNFFKKSAVTTAGLGLTTVIPEAWPDKVSPSYSMNVALIGCRNMGFGILKHHLSDPGVRCIALCDIDESILTERAAEVQKTYGQKPQLFRDFRKLLEQKDIDAVIIGTPDHWHCLITVYALQAGKHVYVEKPMANTIEECNIMARAGRYFSKQVVQVGQQQRSGPIFQKTIELIRNGTSGKLRKINIWANFEYGAGSQIVPDEPVPAGIDFDMWLGPAPVRSFNRSRFHGNWRHFWDYGGGLVSDWGVHLIDAGLWAGSLQAPPPKALVYGANTFHEARSRETFDTMSVIYPYSDFMIYYDVTGGVQRGPAPWDMSYGLAVIGDNATITVDRNKLMVHPEWDGQAKKTRVPEYSYTEGKESHGDHVRNFLASIRDGAKPACPPETGRAAALHVHIANIAARTGESVLLWDDKANRFTNSEAANMLIKPDYRKPWTLPSI